MRDLSVRRKLVFSLILLLVSFYLGFAWAGYEAIETNKLHLKTTSGTSRVTLKAPTLSSSWSMTMPTSAGTADLYLKTNGAGVTSWNDVTDQAANKSLSNLTWPTSVNQHLVASAGTMELGSAATPWNYIRAKVHEFWNSSGTNKITLQAPAALAVDRTYNLPLTDGTAGQVLTTDGVGQLSFTTVSGGGGGGGANTFLSNLIAPTSINQSLIPSSGTLELGSSANAWSKIFSYNLNLIGSASGALTVIPAATTTSHTLTMPAAQGAASTFLKNNGAGSLSWEAPPADTNYGIGAPIGGIGCFITSTTFVATNTGCITNATITTTGRPVLLALVSDASSSAACTLGGISNTTSFDTSVYFRFNRDAGVSTLAPINISWNTATLFTSTMNIPCGSIMSVDTPAAGSHTYSVDGRVALGLRATYGASRVLAIEL